MNSFLGTLQGSYAYLLICQIVIVTTLLLFLLWLIARRLRETGVPETDGGGVVATQDPSLMRLSREQADKISVLERQITELDQGGAVLVQATEKGKVLEDKVKYLEQKLLEYEILQEEISTLSVLKMENEKLRGQVIELGGTPSLRVSAPAAAPSLPTAPVSVLTSDASTTGLKPFEDMSDDKPASNGTLQQDEIDGLIAKIDSLSTKK